MVAIFVVLTIVVFLTIDAILQKRETRRLALAGVPQGAAPRLPKVRVVKGLFYAPNHLWMKVLANGQAKLGIDDFAVKLLGRIDAIETVPAGTYVKKGQPIAWLKQGNRKLALRAPVSGRVKEINQSLLENPQQVKENPYTRGWLLSVEPEDLGETVPKLLIAERAVRWLRREGQRFREFLGETLAARPDVGLTMADGGVPAEGVLSYLDDQAWRECEARFFSMYETE